MPQDMPMTSILTFFCIATSCFLGPHFSLVHGFTIIEGKRQVVSHFVSAQLGPTTNTKSALQMSSGSSSSNDNKRPLPRQNIRLPLLVDNCVSDKKNVNIRQPRWNVPLPNSHLPPELTTASLYELELDVPVHKLVIRHAISSIDANPTLDDDGCCYGHIVKREGDDLIGAIGCAGEILIGAPRQSTTSDVDGRLSGQNWKEDRDEVISNMDGDEEESGPLLVLARGSYRFRVKEVISSIPYPTALVDEIFDEDASTESGTSKDHTAEESSPSEHDDDDDDDDDIYNELSSTELMSQILESLGKVLESQYEASTVPLSPLEQSILESASSPEPMAQAIQRTFDAEERLAVYQTFVASLLDIAPDDRDRRYAVAMIAGELANFSSDVRARMLTTVDGVARLRIVLRELSSMLALESARRMTKSISLGVKDKDEGSESNKDNDNIGSISPPTADTLRAAEDSLKELKVGIPPLPPWANQIKNGIRVEYFWNEIEGWCAGTVVGDPIKIVDEIIVTVQFDDDGSVHRLPLRGEDKARWRPPEIGSWS
ncbi:hypothetical protein HJC23_011652 [Cyclotella cryptica]|uniref:Uncharacterized protein n=1 Tax=Cyclotella cryptica TaxID=29204 RepID=A0ABD3NJ97_9STRA